MEAKEPALVMARDTQTVIQRQVEVGERKHLTSREVERWIEATKDSRNESRELRLDQVDTESRVLHVARLKDGLSTTQPLRTDELRAVNAWLKEGATGGKVR